MMLGSTKEQFDNACKQIIPKEKDMLPLTQCGERNTADLRRQLERRF